VNFCPFMGQTSVFGPSKVRKPLFLIVEVGVISAADFLFSEGIKVPKSQYEAKEPKINIRVYMAMGRIFDFIKC